MATAPQKIKLHKRSRSLEIVFQGQHYQLPAEYLRVYSPSAEVKGHGRGQEVLQTGKREVAITGVEPQGNYAVRLVFSDGHDSGIYTWQYLHELCVHQDTWWQDYVDRLHHANASRDPDTTVVHLLDSGD